MYTYPDFFARFYDVIYEDLRGAVDSEYFLNEILQTKGKVLEIGVGTGRLFSRALEQGADIYGIDVSPPMIEVLKTKIPGEHHHRIELENMITFHHRFTFPLIIAPFRVFMHILTKQEQLDALNQVYAHLEPGGCFIFDVFIPDLYLLLEGIEEKKDVDKEYLPGRKIRRYVTSRPDLIHQILDVTFRIEWDEEDGFRREKWQVPLRFLFRYELEHLLERSEFNNQYTIYGDYNKHELNSSSTDFLVVCTK